MTLSELKNNYAFGFGAKDWNDFTLGFSTEEMEHHMDEIARRYARECIKASLIKASDKLTKFEFDRGLAFTGQDIITSPENITLL